MSKHVREKCGILSISSILSYKRGITPTESDGNWRHLNLIWSIVKQSHMQNFSSICQSMCEKSGENCIFHYFTLQKGALLLQKLTQIDDNRIWSVEWLNKVICKISAQYIKACKRKVRKTVYFQYSKFRKGHNSYRNWRHSNLIYSTVKQSHMQNFSSICQSM